MQTQQWVAEVKIIAGVNPANMGRRVDYVDGEARYASLKELISRKKELEAPLEDDEERSPGSPVGAKGGGRGGRTTGTGRSSSDGSAGGGVGGLHGAKICQGMEGYYEEALTLVQQLEDQAETVEDEVDTWFDHHSVSDTGQARVKSAQPWESSVGSRIGGASGCLAGTTLKTLQNRYRAYSRFM